MVFTNGYEVVNKLIVIGPFEAASSNWIVDFFFLIGGQCGFHKCITHKHLQCYQIQTLV
jgi:hypothetical protein